MLVPKKSHFGPFRSKDKKVIFVISENEQPVVLWDWIRRLFGVYTIVGNNWYIEDNREAVERFTCPFCLSFWTSIPFSALCIIHYFEEYIPALIWIFPVHFTIAVVSQVIYLAVNKWLLKDD